MPMPAHAQAGPVASPAVELIQQMYEAQFIAQNEERLISSFWEWRKEYDAEHARFRKEEAARIEAAYLARITAQADEIELLRTRLECSIETMQHFENWIVNLLASVPREEGEEQHKLFQSLRPEPELLEPLPPQTPESAPRLPAPAKFKSNVALPRFVLLPLAPFAPVAVVSPASDSPNQPAVERSAVVGTDASFQTPPNQIVVTSASNTPSPGAPFALPQSALSMHNNLPSSGKGLFVNRTPPRSPQTVRKGDLFHHARLASAGSNAGGPGEASDDVAPLNHRRNLSATMPSPGTVTRRLPNASSLVFTSPEFLSNAALPSQPNSAAASSPNTPGASPLPAGTVWSNSPATASRVRTLATANPRTGKGEAGVFLDADGRSKKDQTVTAWPSSSSSNLSRTMPAADVMGRMQRVAAAVPSPSSAAALTGSWPKRRGPQLSPRSLHAQRELEQRRQELQRRLATVDSDEDWVELEYHTTSEEESAESDGDSPCISTPNPLLALVASALVGSTPREPLSPRVVAARRTSMARAVQRAKMGLDESSSSASASASASEAEEDGEGPTSSRGSAFPRPKAIVLSNKDVASIGLGNRPEGSLSVSCDNSETEFEDLESGNRSARSDVSRARSLSHTPPVLAAPAPVPSVTTPPPARRLAPLPPPVSVVIEPVQATAVAESPELKLLISEGLQTPAQQAQAPAQSVHSRQPSTASSHGSAAQSPGAPIRQLQQLQGDSIVLAPLQTSSNDDDEASQADLSEDSARASPSSSSQHYTPRFNMPVDSFGTAFHDRDVPASSSSVSNAASAAPMSMSASIAATIVDPFDVDLYVFDRLDGTMRYSTGATTTSLSSSLDRRPSLTSTYIYPQVPKELSPASASMAQEECKEPAASPLARRSKLQIHPAPAAAAASRGATSAAAPIAAVNLSSSSTSSSLTSSAPGASGFVANEHTAFGFRPAPLPVSVAIPPTAPLTPTKPTPCAPGVAPSAHSSRTMTPGLIQPAPGMTPRALALSQTLQPGSIPSAKRAIVFT